MITEAFGVAYYHKFCEFRMSGVIFGFLKVCYILIFQDLNGFIMLPSNDCIHSLEISFALFHKQKQIMLKAQYSKTDNSTIETEH